MKRQNKGITLISLLITIIILLILVGITISKLILNGLIDKAQLAKYKTEKVQKLEYNILNKYEDEISKYVSSDREELNQKIFIDTSKEIACFANLGGAGNESYSYTATEDCAILGEVCCGSSGAAEIYLNSVKIGLVRSRSEEHTSELQSH